MTSQCSVVYQIEEDMKKKERDQAAYRMEEIEKK